MCISMNLQRAEYGKVFFFLLFQLLNIVHEFYCKQILQRNTINNAAQPCTHVMHNSRLEKIEVTRLHHHIHQEVVELVKFKKSKPKENA